MTSSTLSRAAMCASIAASSASIARVFRSFALGMVLASPDGFRCLRLGCRLRRGRRLVCGRRGARGIGSHGVVLCLHFLGEAHDEVEHIFCRAGADETPQLDLEILDFRLLE